MFTFCRKLYFLLTHALLQAKHSPQVRKVKWRKNCHSIARI